MCLSTIFVDDATEPAGRNICKLRMEHGDIIASDIMGREIRLTGEIEDVDLMENTIRIRSAKAS